MCPEGLSNVRLPSTRRVLQRFTETRTHFTSYGFSSRRLGPLCQKLDFNPLLKLDGKKQSSSWGGDTCCLQESWVHLQLKCEACKLSPYFIWLVLKSTGNFVMHFTKIKGRKQNGRYLLRHADGNLGSLSVLDFCFVGFNPNIWSW